MTSIGPQISVVVPALNVEATIGACLDALLEQDVARERYEVTVVDNGSRDATAAVVARHDVRLLHEQRRGAAAARNCGVRASEAPLVAFVDADCVPSRGWLRNLLDPFDDAETTCVAGTSIPLDPSSRIGAYAASVGQYDARHTLAHPRFPYANPANLALRRRVLEAVGMFDPSFRAFEAADLFYRISRSGLLSYRLAPRAVVLFETRRTLPAFVRQNVAYGRGYAQLLHKHRGDLEKGAMRPRFPRAEATPGALHALREGSQRAGALWFRSSTGWRAWRGAAPPLRRVPLLVRVALLVALLPVLTAGPLPRALTVLGALNRAGLRARPDDEAHVVRYVRRLGRLQWWSFRDNCGVFALALFTLLDSDESPLEVCFGVRAAGGATGRRHVWVLRQGEPVHETEPVEDYVVVYRHRSRRAPAPAR